jgi:hypothetical protein
MRTPFYCSKLLSDVYFFFADFFTAAFLTAGLVDVFFAGFAAVFLTTAFLADFAGAAFLADFFAAGFALARVARVFSASADFNSSSNSSGVSGRADFRSRSMS